MRPEDQSLEDYLQGQDGLSERYAELPMPQPSAELDARILAAARESLPVVASQPATATIIPLPNTRRWRLPLALAATVLLSVSVTLKLWEQPGVRMEAQMAAPEAPSVAAPAAPANEPASTAPASAAASAAADAAPAAAPAAAMPAESVEKRLTRRYAETMAPQVKEENGRRAQDAQPSEALRAAKPKLNVDAERATEGRQRDNALGGNAPALAKDSAQQAEPVMEREAKAVASPAPMPAKPNLAPALPHPAAKVAPAGAAAGSLGDKADQNLSAMPGPAPAPVAAMPMAAPPAQVRGLAEEIGAAKAKKSEATAEPATPEAWIKQIREQVARGDELAVREQMRRFRQRYPDFVVPEDLRKWLAPQ